MSRAKFLIRTQFVCNLAIPSIKIKTILNQYSDRYLHSFCGHIHQVVCTFLALLTKFVMLINKKLMGIWQGGGGPDISISGSIEVHTHMPFNLVLNLTTISAEDFCRISHKYGPEVVKRCHRSSFATTNPWCRCIKNDFALHCTGLQKAVILHQVKTKPISKVLFASNWSLLFADF